MPGRILIWFFCLITLLFSLPFAANASDNLLTNADMEDWGEDLPIGWSKSGSKVITASIASDADQIKSGTRSALLKLTSTNEYYLSQALPVSGSTAYRYSGFVRSLTGNFICVLRLAWYSGENKWISTKTSNEITGSTKNFTELSIESTSPAAAKSVQVKVSLIPESGSTDNQVIVDALSFSVISASPDDSSSVQPTPTPNIDFINLPSNANLGETFSINLKLENFDANQDYYLKFRAGTDQNSLNKGQTKNGSAFYADNESWSKFPQITTDSSGKWEGQLSARIGEDKPAGQYTVRVRVRKRDADTFYDSETKNISLSAPPETMVETPILKPAASPAGTINLVLGTTSAATAAPIAQEIPEDQIANSPAIIPVAIVLVTLGALLSSLALLFVRYNVRHGN